MLIEILLFDVAKGVLGWYWRLRRCSHGIDKTVKAVSLPLGSALRTLRRSLGHVLHPLMGHTARFPVTGAARGELSMDTTRMG